MTKASSDREKKQAATIRRLRKEIRELKDLCSELRQQGDAHRRLKEAVANGDVVAFTRAEVAVSVELRDRAKAQREHALVELAEVLSVLRTPAKRTDLGEERARLAAQAPAMARLLLDGEWLCEERGDMCRHCMRLETTVRVE